MNTTYAERNGYGAIAVAKIPTFIKPLLAELEQAGAWETGFHQGRKNRWVAVNVDTYGYDQNLAVVQVRRSERTKYGVETHKSYFLVGRTEQGSPFSHPIKVTATPLANRSPQEAVRYVLAKIWNCKESDLPYIERQGDVAFIPVSRIPTGAEPIAEAVLRDTHMVTGDLFKAPDGTLYAKRGARLVHTKNQHRPVKAREGVYRVQPGMRATPHPFALQLGD